jgi:hypothetical protein
MGLSVALPNRGAGEKRKKHQGEVPQGDSARELGHCSGHECYVWVTAA